eukprot:CAMPEP_0185575992 /NCGR_PEP_ID=MMETSP0434-20130131/7026_1 /TAXON_ID=626734 ORGANISM="Favella taraikaensis, Strain Fe Narragansett Bay" /NCGR_SAMPLE_ID=MMETSP0434 /ASSEMBLY_ACC=CAM_ASM_000379 /LENGTH=62 /DNA_ID=CAMNT_0028193035 /DNA_START=251 /DNA_END=436 /DNA_ORIENTATION=-
MGALSPLIDVLCVGGDIGSTLELALQEGKLSAHLIRVDRSLHALVVEQDGPEASCAVSTNAW